MKNINVKPIGVTGVEKEGIELSGMVKDFKIRDILKIPKDMSTITTLTSVSISLENIELEVFETFKAENNKGELLTGKKAFITGILVSNYKYITNQYIKKVRNIKFETPFSTYVNIEEEFLQKENFLASLYVQDVEVRAVGKRKIYQHILVALSINNSVESKE